MIRTSVILVACIAFIHGACAEIVQDATVTATGFSGALQVQASSTNIQTADGTPELVMNRPGSSEIAIEFSLSETLLPDENLFLVMSMASDQAPQGLTTPTYTIGVNGTEIGSWTHHFDRYHLHARNITSRVASGRNTVTVALDSQAAVNMRIRYLALTRSESASFVEPQVDRLRVGERSTKIPLIAALLVTCATLCTVIYYYQWRAREAPIRSAQINAIIACGFTAFLSVLVVYGVSLLSILGGFGAVGGVVALIFLLNR